LRASGFQRLNDFLLDLFGVDEPLIAFQKSSYMFLACIERASIDQSFAAPPCIVSKATARTSKRRAVFCVTMAPKKPRLLARLSG
jgi:hypothetical protein